MANKPANPTPVSTPVLAASATTIRDSGKQRRSKISVVKDAAEKGFEAESKRTENLFAKAEKLVAGVAAVTGFQVIDAKNLVKTQSSEILNGSALVFLFFALFLAFLAMKVRDYVSYPRGNVLWDKLICKEVSAEAAEAAIALMLLKAKERNASLNDRNALLVAASCVALVLGFLFAVAAQLFART